MSHTEKEIKESVEEILSAPFIRKQAQMIWDLTLKEQTHFKLNLAKLPKLAEEVWQHTLTRFPGGIDTIDPHSRFNHFRCQQVDRVQWLVDEMNFRGVKGKWEQAKELMDLTVYSVLLDAGAGPGWKYTEKETGLILGRSEGLGVASLQMFRDGLFSDVKKLALMDEEMLAKLRVGMQISATNPLQGGDGRFLLIQKLAQTMLQDPLHFGQNKTLPPRPSDLMEFARTHLTETQNSGGLKINLSRFLSLILKSFGPIWPGRVIHQGVNLGDTWWYEPTGQLVSFHKLSQWLTYSLMEVFKWAQVEVTHQELLTGLPEYRNGGLFLDAGVLEIKANFQHLLKVPLPPHHPLIIEWRALTVMLLDQISFEIRKLVGLKENDYQKLPLAVILEGGTWDYGRFLAKKLRAEGGPPMNIESDGTVF